MHELASRQEQVWCTSAAEMKGSQGGAAHAPNLPPSGTDLHRLPALRQLLHFIQHLVAPDLAVRGLRTTTGWGSG